MIDPKPVLDLLDGFRRSKVMFVSVSMGIFDRLAKEPATAADLAVEMKANAVALEQLLDSCVGLELLAKKENVYSNTALASTYLVAGNPRSLRGYIRYSDMALYPMWSNLQAAVVRGTHRWKQTFGSEGATLFEHFFNTEEKKREFLAGMHGRGMISSAAVAAAFDLSHFRRLVDLGGATGHLVIAACERYPELEGTVFDLPDVMPIAREYVLDCLVADRIDLAPGDFFSDELPPADLYALGQILHDWSDAKVALLLRKVRVALGVGGGLLIAEKLLDDDKTGPVTVQLQSLNMLVCTEGRERTVAEYTALLQTAGFSKVQARRTGKTVDAVLATV
ncbi:MAG TPA: class I SAM-dependent methyltransferase [Bryobacteraceae bacterium]|nr:class I SAM-dependent methyltransferase [Bryobacteraceae bacterium]